MRKFVLGDVYFLALAKESRALRFANIEFFPGEDEEEVL